AGDVGGGIGVRVEPLHRDDLFGLARAPPVQGVRCVARVLEVFELDVAAFAGHQRDGAGGGDAGVGPTVDEELAVDPEFDAVVGLREEAVRFGVFGLHLTGPADGKCVHADGRVGRAWS